MTPELPPPSGPPQAAPVAELPPTPVTQTQPPSPYAVPPGPFQPGQPDQAPLPAVPRAGRVNALAIAALCCGLAAFVPLVGVLAVIFGAVALNQLRSGFQRGRGRAIAGIVLGSLGTLAWAAVLAIAVVAALAAVPQPGTTGQAAGQAAGQAGRSQVFVDKLKAGDCFLGGGKDQIDLVTPVPCTSPHESQVVTVIELPGGPYPGEAKVTAEAEKGCTDKAEPLVTDTAIDDLDPSYIYPDADTWQGDRSVLCLVDAPSGTTTGSALK
ncbi:DUF4190 domain-containing protein [Terrabacter sp. BE26]|uniref:DUF4190 domain-containing protein n=1 Tax=Terrabacter sp. BE26 TaxID=2898152 RepID=UPI0035BE5F4B